MMKLLSTKTVIYVTHQLEFLDAADLVLVRSLKKYAQFSAFSEILCFLF